MASGFFAQAPSFFTDIRNLLVLQENVCCMCFLCIIPFMLYEFYVAEKFEHRLFDLQ